MTYFTALLPVVGRIIAEESWSSELAYLLVYPLVYLLTYKPTYKLTYEPTYELTYELTYKLLGLLFPYSTSITLTP